MTASMKWASETGIGVNTYEMVFYRSLFGLPVLLIWLASGPGLGVIRTRRPLAHFGRSALGICSLLVSFQALILLPLASAVTISFTAPAFATILSALLLHEKVGPHRWAAVIAGFIGVAIVVRPGGDVLPVVGVMLALLGAIGTGGVTVAVRKLGGTEHPGAIVFWFFLFGAIAAGVGVMFTGQAHTPATWGLLVLAGISGAAGQILMTMSLRAAPVSVVSPFDYTQIIWASVLGWLIWSTIPTTSTFAGAALISLSGLYIAVREHRLRRETIPATPPIE